MGTISKNLTISQSGVYDFDISLWTAIINLTASSSELYGHSVTVTTPSGTDTVVFSSTGSLSYKVHESGAYTFSVVYDGSTYSVTVEANDETTYTSTLDLWKSTVNLTTTSSEFYGGTVTITSPVLSAADTVTFSSSGSATYIANKAGTYNFAITYGGKTYEKSLEVTSQTTYTVELETLEIVGWSSATDEQLVAMVEALDAGEITTDDLPWAVGDERPIHISRFIIEPTNWYMGEHDAELVILDKRSYNGVGHYIIGFKNSLYTSVSLEKYSTDRTNQNGWHGCLGKTICDNIFDKIFASSINNIFKTFTVYTATKGGSDNPGLTAAIGKMQLLAVKEITGEKSNGTQSEFADSRISQIEYYKIVSNRKKTYQNGSNGTWWTRSPYYDNTSHFVQINYLGTDIVVNSAASSSGLSPFMVI